MSSWPNVNLRRVTTLGTGHTPSRQRPEYWEDCTIPWLTLADVGRLRDGTVSVIMETAEKVSERGIANSSAIVHPAGTVAMSRTASVGYTCILGADMATSQDFVTWTCGPSLDPRFLLHALRAQRDQILSMRMGSTHQTIYVPDIERISVPLPPLAVQRRIADYLDRETARINALVAKKQQMGRLVDQWEQRRLLDLVGDWSTDATMTLRQYGTSVLTGPFGSVLSASEYIEGGIPLINPTHIVGGRLVPEAHITVPHSVAQRIRRHRLREGDLVMGRKGDVGRSAIVDAQADGWLCGSDSIAIRCDRSSLVPDYLALALRTAWYRQQLASRSTGATLANVNEPTLLSLRLPARSVDEQLRTVESAKSVLRLRESVAARLERQIELLVEHRQALTTAVVTGELEAPGVAA